LPQTRAGDQIIRQRHAEQHSAGFGGSDDQRLGEDACRVLNRGAAARWTVERLRRTVRRLASEGIVETHLLNRARPQSGDDRLIRLVAGIKAAAPERTLQQIAQLEAICERTLRGGTRWHPS
jgi:hypothetical protein